MKTMRKLFPISKSLPQDYEMWLENFEANGWHLKDVSFWGWLHYFVKDQPKKYRYCYDFQGRKKKDYDVIFKDTGWELVCYYFGAYIWRKEYINERPEAFSDNITLLERNNRLLILTVACFALYPAVILNMIHSFDRKSPFEVILLLFIIVVFLGGITLIAGLLRINNKLKKQINK